MTAVRMERSDRMELSDETLCAVSRGELNFEKLRQDVISTVTGIDLISEPISYERFFLDYLLPNRACILGSWATDGWQSRTDWVSQENTPNIQFLKESFGNCICPVADCGHNEYDAHTKKSMSLTDYISYIEEYRDTEYPPDTPCMYLKDWHFHRECPQYSAYEVPVFFQSDWMNEFWDERDDSTDDYRFVYFGPKGSWTPFHADVFRSYSWSANICGRKLWTIFPPGQEKYLTDRLGNLPLDLRSPQLDDRSLYPNIDDVTRRFEVYQEAGQVIFVPSGWFHQVINLEDTISINHNWSNACNIDLCWRHLESSLCDVQREISDCRDMDGFGNQCQLILKANAGMDYTEFYRLLLTIAKNRIARLQLHLGNGSQTTHPLVNEERPDSENTCDHENEQKDLPGQVKESCTVLSNHYIFDLLQIRKLVDHMKRNKDFLQLDFDEFEIRPKALIASVDGIIKKFQVL